MNIIGIGKKLFAVTFLYSLLVLYLHFNFYPYFAIHASWVWFLGVALMIAGAVLIFKAVRVLYGAICKEELATEGPYAIFANPIYAAWILFILPGLSFFIYSWLMLSSSIVMYVALRVFIRSEEDALSEKFADSYTEYRKKVLIKFL